MTLLFIFLTLNTLAQAKSDYTLTDLEILAAEESFEEFFEHAMDVRPSERQEAWKVMVAKMAEGHARKILSTAEVQRKTFLKIESLFQWPALKTDDVFKGRRQEIGLRYLKACLKKETPCWGDLKAFWEADQSDADTAFRLAELVIEQKESPLPVWNFLGVALKSPLSEFYCKKDFVLDAIWGKLEIDYIRLGNQGDFLKKIDETLHYDCLIPLNKLSSSRLLRPYKSAHRELAFQILSAQGKITQELTDFFYTVYLLENPSKGDLFNLSWNRLTELSKNSDRRDKVLARLKTLDPLPDELFSSMDVNKTRAILTHFSKSFPEYISFYANQCIRYYGGTSVFQNGNPTMHCQDLMGSELAVPFLGTEKVQEYQKSRKI